MSEKPVLESLETAKDASKAFRSSLPHNKTNGEGSLTPIQVLGALIVQQRAKQHPEVLFASLLQDETVEQEKGESSVGDETKLETEAARELKGPNEELICTLQGVLMSSFSTALDDLNVVSHDKTKEGGVGGEWWLAYRAGALQEVVFRERRHPLLPPLRPLPLHLLALGNTKEGEAPLELGIH